MGGVPRGGGASLQAQLRHLEGPRSELGAGARPAPRVLPEGEPGGGARGEPLYILHSVPLVPPAHVARRSLYSRVGTPGTPHRGPRDSHPHARTHTDATPSVCPPDPGLRPGPAGPSGRQRTTSSTASRGCSHIGGGSARRPAALHVRGPPLPGGAGGSRSWANTESSPEELELGVSRPPGEYCSKGTDRSRYSCRRAAVRAGPSPHPCRAVGRWVGAGTHVGGRDGEDAVQVLHQLLERGPLRGHGVPALPHDHVPGGRSGEAPGPLPPPPRSSPPAGAPKPRPRGPAGRHTHRSCVQLAGLSMR